MADSTEDPEDEFNSLSSSNQGYTPMNETKDPRKDENDLMKQRKEARDHPKNKELWSHPQAPKKPGAPDKIQRDAKALELEKEQKHVSLAQKQTKHELDTLNKSSKKTRSKSKKK